MPTTIARAAIFEALIDAVDTVRALNKMRPSRLERINHAWDWLLQQEVYTLNSMDDLIVPSESRPDVFYRVSWRGCECPARQGCWHIEAASILGRAQRYGAIDRTRPATALPFCERPSPTHYSRANDPRVSADELVADLYS